MNSAGLEQDWEARCNATAFIAVWLAEVFIAPLTIVAVSEHCSTDGAQLLEAIGDELGCRSAIDRMRSALSGGAAAASIERELSIAYTLLFEGVAGSATVPLYESAYGGEGTRLFQRATADMESMLQDCALSVSKDCCEPPDHLSIELALLAAVLRDDDKPRAAFLRDRLRAWVPEFAARCNKADGNGFYGGAAMVLNGLLAAPTLHDLRCAA
jgi:TorA-specific chaperone